MAEQFDIRARLVIDDKPAARGLDAVDRRIRQTETTANQAGNNIASTLRRAFAGAAVLGAGRAALGVARGFIGIQTEVQNAEGSIASLTSALFGIPIEQSVGVARKQVRGLSEDAARGVGELKDYTKAFQLLLAPTSAAGASLEQIREFTRTSLTAGFSIKGIAGLEQAPLDIVQALQSGINEKITPIAARVVEAAGIGAAEFNKLDVEGKMEALAAGFGRFEGGAELLGKTWEAQTATLQDQMKQIIRRVSKPLFDKWSTQLAGVNKWLADNSEAIGVIADRWGPRLVGMWDQLISRAGTYAAIVAGASIAQALPALPGLPGGRSTGGAGGLLSRVAGVGGAAGGAGAAGGGGGIMAALRGVFAGFSRLAVPVAIVTTAIFAVMGAFSEFPGLLIMLKDAGSGLFEALGNLGNSFGFLTGQGSALNLVGGGLILMLTGLVRALQLVTNGVALVIDAIGILVSLMGDVFKFATTGLKGTLQLLSGNKEGGFETMRGLEKELAKSGATRKAAVDDINRILFGTGKDGKSAKAKEDDASLTGGIGGKKLSAGGTTNHIGSINVQVKAEVNEDPARVASAFDEVLDGLKRFTTQPRRLPTGPNLG